MRILLTGGTGFVGRGLVKRLLQDHEVVCLARRFDGLPSDPRLQCVSQDLSMPLDEAVLPDSLDVIIHLAQSRSFRMFPAGAQDMFSVNTQRTFELLEHGRRAKIRSFIFASSGGVGGFRADPIRETDCPAPGNFYLSSKYASECLINAYRACFTTVNLRYFFVYGEGQRGMFLPGLVQRVLEGSPVSLSGDTGLRLNPIHVADAVEATARAIDVHSSETINVGGTEITSIRSLAELIGRVAGREPIYERDPDSHAPSMIASLDKMQAVLKLEPAVSLEEGVARLVRDMRNEQEGTMP